MHSFPRADIHKLLAQLLAPDNLHQLIKGIFKDHLVEWINEYLRFQHGTARAEEIIEDIDHRSVPLTMFLWLIAEDLCQQLSSCACLPWYSTLS
jgi:TorA maturation chaperone TorD